MSMNYEKIPKNSNLISIKTFMDLFFFPQLKTTTSYLYENPDSRIKILEFLSVNNIIFESESDFNDFNIFLRIIEKDMNNITIQCFHISKDLDGMVLYNNFYVNNFTQTFVDEQINICEEKRIKILELYKFYKLFLNYLTKIASKEKLFFERKKFLMLIDGIDLVGQEYTPTCKYLCDNTIQRELLSFIK